LRLGGGVAYPVTRTDPTTILKIGFDTEEAGVEGIAGICSPGLIAALQRYQTYATRGCCVHVCPTSRYADKLPDWARAQTAFSQSSQLHHEMWSQLRTLIISSSPRASILYCSGKVFIRYKSRKTKESCCLAFEIPRCLSLKGNEPAGWTGTPLVAALEFHGWHLYILLWHILNQHLASPRIKKRLLPQSMRVGFTISPSLGTASLCDVSLKLRTQVHAD
jgi:hypothetical protein